MGIGRKVQPPLLLFNFQSFAKKHPLPPPALCHLTSLWECLGMGSLEAKRRGKKRKKPIRIPAKCLPLPLALCAQGKQSQLSATCLCPDGTLLLLGLCAVLGQLPPWMGTSPFVTTAGATPEHTSGGVSCGTGAELVSWGRTGTELTARAGVSGVCDSSGSRTGGRTRWQRWEV